MSKTITVRGMYSGNDRTTTIRVDVGGAINTRQVAAAIKRLKLIGGDHITIVRPSEITSATIYDRNGNYAGDLS